MRQFLADMRGRVAALLYGAREDDELRAELEFHMAMEAEARQGGGDAHPVRQARLKFGSEERWLEESRDARGVSALTDFGQDVRLALREMRRQPAFAFTAVVALGLGMGGVTAAFSVMNRVLLHPLPGVRQADRLVTVRFQEDEWNGVGLSVLNFRDLTTALSTVESFVGYVPTSLQVLPAGGRAMDVEGVSVIGDYFGALGLVPGSGRFFTRNEATGVDDENVAVISDRFWRQQYGARPIAGTTLRMNGLTFSIVGVAPRGFHGTTPLEQADVWLPAAAYSAVRHLSGDLAARRSADMFRQFFARLAPGAAVAEAERELQLRLDQLAVQYPAVKRQYEQARARVYAGVGLPPESRAGAQRTMRLMLAVAAVVLLIATANVANLLLFRGLRGRGDSAVRRALGASTRRLVQHNAAQGILLATIGGVTGVLLAALVLRAAKGVVLPGIGALVDIPLDTRVLAFTAILVAATAVLFTIVPTLLALAWPLLENLREAARGETGRTGWIRRGLVVVQIALSAALVVPALLLMRSVQNLNAVDLGFDPEHVYAFGVDVEPQGYTTEQRNALTRQLLDAVRAHPAIDAVATTSHAPFSPGSSSITVHGALQTAGTDGIDVNAEWISDGYLRTLRVPLVRGNVADADRLLVGNTESDGVLINESAARRLFGNIDVIGRTFDERGFSGAKVRRVVGVVGDTRVWALRESPPLFVYRPSADYYSDWLWIVARSTASPGQVEAIMTEAMQSLDPAIPFFRAEPVARMLRHAMGTELMFARMSAVLGILAALLAAIGLYGLMGYSVEQRRREIGIRMALGARVSRVIALVTGETLRLAFAGVILGCVGGWALSRLLQHLLYGVGVMQVSAYAAAGLAFALIALLAAAVPARSAARVQPATTLRQE